jgi:O-antigen ligase
MNFLKSEVYKTNIKLLLLTLFFVTIPLKNNINSISIILLALYATTEIKQMVFSRLRAYFPLTAYYVFIVLSLLYTKDIENGLDYVILFLPFVLFPFIFSIIKLTNQELKLILKWFAIWLVILILYSEISIIFKILDKDLSLYLMFRKDYSYIELGNVIGIHPPYMVLLISFVVFYLISKFEQTGINKVLQTVMLLLFLFYIIHLSSRLPMLMVMLISLILVFKKIRKRLSLMKSFSIILLIIVIAGGILYGVRSARYRFMELIGMQYANGVYIKSAPSKFFQWSAAFKANDNVLFGNGIGDAEDAIIDSNYKEGLYKNVHLRYNAHNQYLQTYVGLGLMGLICLVFMLYYFFVSNSNLYLKSASLAFLAYLVVCFLTESYLERHQGVVFLAFMMCFISKKNSGSDKT